MYMHTSVDMVRFEISNSDETVSLCISRIHQYMIGIQACI